MKANPRHEAFYNAVTAMMKEQFADVDGLEVLAVLSTMVGKVIAMQDQRKYTPDQIVRMVVRNIEVGNAEMMADLLKPAKGSA